MISVDICRDPVAWDRYVESRPEAYNYHRWRWKGAIEETFNHAGYYLAATDAAGQIRGALPLFSIKSHLFGRSLVSVPFFTYGGMLANDSEAAEALLNK